MLFQIGKLKNGEQITSESYNGTFIEALIHVLNKNDLYCSPIDEEAKVNLQLTKGTK